MFKNRKYVLTFASIMFGVGVSSISEARLFSEEEFGAVGPVPSLVQKLDTSAFMEELRPVIPRPGNLFDDQEVESSPQGLLSLETDEVEPNSLASLRSVYVASRDGFALRYNPEESEIEGFLMTTNGFVEETFEVTLSQGNVTLLQVEVPDSLIKTVVPLFPT